MALPMQFAPVPKQKRSALNTSLYSSIVLMQALDVHSTYKAFNVGATEGNPLMSGIAKSPVAFVATKAAVAATTILAVRHLAKRSRIAAILTTAAVNSAYAMVVRHNYDVANGR
jgi:ethanolamine utilization protein EutP (predicted NTPase)